MVILVLIFVSFAAVGQNISKIESNKESVIDNQIEELKRKAEVEGWTFTVGENSATNYSIDELCGLVEPPNWKDSVDFDPLYNLTFSVPEQWDWRDEGGCTSIKNQGNCGSCWAFGTIAPLESAIKIRTGENVDLSEQWLVSCNKAGWGCNGGWWAHGYHAGLTGKCGGTGAVLERDFPYTAYDEFCNGPYPHAYLLVDSDGDGNSWKYIGSENGIPSVDQIKQAIYDYGPISAAVYVDTAFHTYTGGVFTNQGSGQVNHAIALVGWDDNQGKDGVWILKNSWGTGWGENGYMRIEYGANNVGYSACFIDDYESLDPNNIEIKIDLEMYRLTNDPQQGDFDLIELLPFDKPEWYYRVGFESDGDTTYQYHYNKKEDPENPGSWWDYAHEYTWYVDQDHVFYTTSPTPKITIKLMEYDNLGDDLADVSAKSGGGTNDNTNDKREAIYHGNYDLRTDSLTGDSTTDEGQYKVTTGDGKNNAKVWFKITDNYIAEKYFPDIDVQPDYLSFGEVKKGTSHEKYIEIFNTAPKDPLDWVDDLEWSASSDRSWISFSKKSGSLSGSKSERVKVIIDTSGLGAGQTHSGNIKISSNDKDENVRVTVSIEKARTKTYNRYFVNLQKYIPNLFIFFELLLQKLQYK
jgi:C1A family cysteine protease